MRRHQVYHRARSSATICAQGPALLALAGGVLALVCAFVPWLDLHPEQGRSTSNRVTGLSHFTSDCGLLVWALVATDVALAMDGLLLVARCRALLPTALAIWLAVLAALVTLGLGAYLMLGYIESASIYQPSWGFGIRATLDGYLLVIRGRAWHSLRGRRTPPERHAAQ